MRPVSPSVRRSVGPSVCPSVRHAVHFCVFLSVLMSFEHVSQVFTSFHKFSQVFHKFFTFSLTRARNLWRWPCFLYFHPPCPHSRILFFFPYFHPPCPILEFILVIQLCVWLSPPVRIPELSPISRICNSSLPSRNDFLWQFLVPIPSRISPFGLLFFLFWYHRSPGETSV